jgi:hypothetical protein
MTSKEKDGQKLDEDFVHRKWFSPERTLTKVQKFTLQNLRESAVFYNQR